MNKYSRKRVLKIVREKSTYETAKYLKELETRMGFRIKTIRKTRPYSPWQNGKVERSHREDGKILYGRQIFFSKKMLLQAVEKHERRYNRTAKRQLNFKSPNHMVIDYFSKCNKCLDT